MAALRGGFCLFAMMKKSLSLLALLLVAAGRTVGAEASAATALPHSVSLQDCIEMALRNNLELRIERYNPQLALYDVNAARGGYDPVVRGSAEHDNRTQGARIDELGRLVPSYSSLQNSYNGGVGGLLPWGMTYDFAANVSPQTGERVIFNPVNSNYFKLPLESSYGDVRMRLTQPLLKNFLIDSTRLNISTAKLRLKSSEQSLRQKVMDVVTRVETAYYDLLYARQALAVQEQALALTRRLEQENRKKLEVGSIAKLDLTQAEAQAASTEADLLTAQRNLAIQMNVLKQLLSDDFAAWANDSLEPSGQLTAERQFFNRQESWSKGLMLRPDLLQARLEVERSGIQVKYDKNQLLPQLDLIGSYGLTGTGVRTGYALDQLTSRDQPYWAVGGQISFPIGNHSARSRYAASRAVADQTLISLKRLEQQVLVQIDDAIKQAQSSYDRVLATRKAVEYSKEAFDGEQKKLDNGASTAFQVLRLQRDLTAAQSDEIQALAAYQKALALLAQFEGSTLERRGIDLTIY
jgi:outer membrane protein